MAQDMEGVDRPKSGVVEEGGVKKVLPFTKVEVEWQQNAFGAQPGQPGYPGVIEKMHPILAEKLRKKGWVDKPGTYKPAKKEKE